MIEPDMRTCERMSLEIPALLHAADEQGSEPRELVTDNICTGGAYFRTSRPMRVGTAVTMEMLIPIDPFRKAETEQTHYALAGTVVRCDGKGMAVCFEREAKMTPLG
jgi:hypothetical protein